MSHVTGAGSDGEALGADDLDGVAGGAHIVHTDTQETVRFAFQKIAIENPTSSTSTSDDWNTPGD